MQSLHFYYRMPYIFTMDIIIEYNAFSIIELKRCGFLIGVILLNDVREIPLYVLLEVVILSINVLIFVLIIYT